MLVLNNISQALGLYNRPQKEIKTIKIMIDSPYELTEKADELFEIAAIISALIHNPNTSHLGTGLYKIIENRMSNDEETSSNKDAYIGIRRISAGYKFYLCRNRSENIAFSNLYSQFDSCSNGIISARNASMGDIDDTTIEENDKRKIKCPKFEVYTDISGCYRFRLRSVNGLIILSSYSYTEKQYALNDIMQVKELLNIGEIRKE